MTRPLRTCLAALALAGVAALGQAPVCAVANDALAQRRALLQSNLATLNSDSLAAKKQQAAADTDSMVLLGDYYAAQHQADEATRWWTTAAQSGNPFGYDALALQASADLTARRRFYAQAAQLGDPEAERAYGEMLLKGEGGPRLSVLGREYLIKAARDGGLDALVLVGAGYVGLPDAPYAEVFQPIKDPALGDCYLTAAAHRDSPQARRTLRQAYDAGLLKDPLPTPRLSDTNAFLAYLKSYDPAEQVDVLSRAMASDPGSPNTTRALEERVWLSPPPQPGADPSPALQILLARDPHNATALYFSLLADLPSVPHDATRGNVPVLHTDAAVALGAKLTEEGVSGLAGLDNPALSLGLDQDVFQRRLVQAKRAFQQAADLAQPLAQGRLWTHPQTADDVVADYMYQRGGFDKLMALGAAHLTVNVTLSLHGKDDQTWQREVFIAQEARYPYRASDASSSADDFNPPALDPNTVEAIVSNGHGWAMKNDYGPLGWTPDITPEKRDKKIPAEFGALHAPYVGDLDGPLVDYSRLRAAHLPAPSLQLLGREALDGHPVYHLSLAAMGDASPDYDLFVDATNYELLRLSWSWESGKDTQIVDYSDFSRRSDVLFPMRATFTYFTGSNSDNANVEADAITALDLNPRLDPTLFSLSKDQAHKFKQALEQQADDKKKRDKPGSN